MKFGICSLVLLAVAATCVNALDKPYIVSIHNVEMPSMSTAAPSTTTTVAGSTTPAATTTPAGAFQKAYDFIQSHLPAALQAKVEGHVVTAVCTGTIISPHAVITTHTCVMRAKSATGMPIWISTAEDNTSIDLEGKEYIPIESEIHHPDFNMETNTYDLVILTVSADNPIEFMDYYVQPINWGSIIAPMSALCESTYWQSVHPFNQKTTDVIVMDCAVSMEMTVCASSENVNSKCVGPQDGSALVCGNQLAGLFTFYNEDLCDIGGPLPYIDVSKYSNWMWDTVNTLGSGASYVHLSLTALLALVYVTVSNC